MDETEWRWVHALVIPLIKSLVQKVESLSVRYIPLGNIHEELYKKRNEAMS